VLKNEPLVAAIPYIVTAAQNKQLLAQFDSFLNGEREPDFFLPETVIKNNTIKMFIVT